MKNELDELANLENNWNGYGAKPIPKEAIERARALLLLMAGVEPEIFPTGRETVQLEWETPESYMEIEVYKDKIEITFQN